MPETLNRYGYCWGNPVGLVDLDGKEPEGYYVYYLNNMDGADSFGHNAILIQNIDGSSEFYSFMGTGALPGILNPAYDALGYMAHEKLGKEETESFLSTGDIAVEMPHNPNAEPVYNDDNYGRALKKEISAEEYCQIQQKAQQYVDLYEEGRNIDNEAYLEIYLEANKAAKYNLYSHNCDHVAGEIISVVDPNFIAYSGYISVGNPNDSYFVKSELLSDSWENISIGDIDFIEALCATPSRSCAIELARYQFRNKIKKICGIE